MSEDNSGKKTKRYSLSKEEMQKIQNIHSVLGIMALQREGMNHSLTLELARVRERLLIREKDAPEGFVRSVEFDPEEFELIVTDTPMIKEPVIHPKQSSEAKN
jgi:hypothetical protein